ncbi:MAG: type II toxin-antitoxin system RelE/ParE family toxin [Opitutae bacterium]|nr:type II toxin-antitoxin system RelE/ParE family toxin [Opitutae bacterium]
MDRRPPDARDHACHAGWHLIFYRVDEAAQTVTIVRIWDARQDPDLLWP